eukprot:3393804-Rhodomonas_salina.3
MAQTLGLEELYKVKPAVRRAFRATKLLRRGRRGARDDEYVGRSDFRSASLTARACVTRCTALTCCMISGHERQIDVGEFRDAAERSVRCLRVFALRNEALGPSEQILMLCRNLYEWGAPVDIENPDETFNQIDAEGTGRIEFIDFTEWAIRGKLSAQAFVLVLTELLRDVRYTCIAYGDQQMAQPGYADTEVGSEEDIDDEVEGPLQCPVLT